MANVAESGEPLLANMGLEEDTSPGLFVGPKAKDVIAYDLWQMQSQLFKLRKEYLEHWQKTVSRTGTGRPVDAIICPASASVATTHGKNLYVPALMVDAITRWLSRTVTQIHQLYYRVERPRLRCDGLPRYQSGCRY